MEPHSNPIKLLECEDEKFDLHLFGQLIRSLMQLSTWIKPDISCVVLMRYQTQITAFFF
jgi:hypothetical protein